MIKYGAVSKPTDDSGRVQVVQVRTQSVTRDFLSLYPYGFFANAPEGSLAVMFNLNGQEENKAGIPFIPQETFAGAEGRFKDLKPGEVLVGNVLTRAYVKFDLDGNIEVYSPANITATADANIIANAGADITATATGDATLNATNVTINASGTLSVSADTANVTADSVTLGGAGGPAVARVGDSVSGGVITSGSSKVTAA